MKKLIVVLMCLISLLLGVLYGNNISWEKRLVKTVDRCVEIVGVYKNSYDKCVKEKKQKFKLINWVLENNNYSNPLHLSQIISMVDVASLEYDAPLIIAIAKVESGFRSLATSEKGCIGVMQINPIHCPKYNISSIDLYSVPINVWVACQLLKKWGINPKNPDYKKLTIKYLGVYSKTYEKKIKKYHQDILQTILKGGKKYETAT